MKLCLGTVQFGMDYGIQGAHQQSYEKIEEIISYAINNGVYMFDTAATYGEAENVLGHYFSAHPLKMDKIRMVAKLAPQIFKNSDKEAWSRAAIESAKRTIDTLGIEMLDAYLFHDASYIYNYDAVRALHQVKENGFAKRVGVSIYTPDEAMKALEYEEINAIQIPYNIFDQRLDKSGFFEKAIKQNIIVFARSTMLQGLALMESDKLPVHMQFASEYLKKFSNLCNKYAFTPIQAAVGYVEKHEGINFIVFGVDCLNQLKEYINVQNTQIPESMIEEIHHTFANVEERLVNPTLWGGDK